jgi:Adenovirus endoprotease
MQTTELSRACESCPVIRDSLIAVCAADEALSYWREISAAIGGEPFFPRFAIVNTESREHAGRHWVLMMMRGFDKAPVFFDPYGRDVADSDEFSFDVRSAFAYARSFSGTAYERNDRQLQADTGKTSGMYCMYVAYMLCKYPSLSLEFVLRRYSPRDPSGNDVLVDDWCEQHFTFSRKKEIGGQTCVAAVGTD